MVYTRNMLQVNPLQPILGWVCTKFDLHSTLQPSCLPNDSPEGAEVQLQSIASVLTHVSEFHYLCLGRSVLQYRCAVIQGKITFSMLILPMS